LGGPLALILPLAVWYGISSQLQFGLVHSNGLCLSGKDNGCGKVYDDVGAQLLYSITGRGGNFELAAWTQLNYSSFDKGTLNLQLGPAINWVIAGNAALLAYPALQIGLDKRSELGNKEALLAPVYVYYRAAPHVAPVLYTGISGPLDGFGDAYRVPVGVGALVGINAMWDVGARFDFSNLLGKHATGVGAATSERCWSGSACGRSDDGRPQEPWRYHSATAAAPGSVRPDDEAADGRRGCNRLDGPVVELGGGPGAVAVREVGADGDLGLALR